MIAAFELPNRVSTVSAETVAQIGFVPKRVDRKETVGRNRPQRKKKKAQRGRGGPLEYWVNQVTVKQLKAFVRHVRDTRPDSSVASIDVNKLNKQPLAQAISSDESGLLTQKTFSQWLINASISDPSLLETDTTGTTTPPGTPPSEDAVSRLQQSVQNLTPQDFGLDDTDSDESDTDSEGLHLYGCSRKVCSRRSVAGRSVW